MESIEEGEGEGEDNNNNNSSTRWRVIALPMFQFPSYQHYLNHYYLAKDNNKRTDDNSNSNNQNDSIHREEELLSYELPSNVRIVEKIDGKIRDVIDIRIPLL